MSFFNKLGKKIEDATQTATKKSSEFMEITKLNAEIKSKEEKINKLYFEIGKKVYDSWDLEDEIFEGFSEIVKEIRNSKTEIQKLNERVLELKKVRLCTNCGQQISRESIYCDKCGTKQELIEEDKEGDGFITIDSHE